MVINSFLATVSENDKMDQNWLFYEFIFRRKMTIQRGPIDYNVFI